MRSRLPLIVLTVLLLGVGPAGAQDAPAADPVPEPAVDPLAAPSAPAPPNAVEQRLDEIDQRARIAERKLELIEEEAARQKEAGAVTAIGDKGFSFKSADAAFGLRLRAFFHADGRQYLDDPVLRERDTFLIRRARPIIEATFFDIADFRLMPDFGNGQATLVDAFVDLRPFPWLKLRAGKFRPPISLERLQSASAIVFPERGLPSAIAPNRDVGAMLHGTLASAIVNYELGVWNGVPDGASGDLDNNRAKDVGGRLFFAPWRGDPYSRLANLGLGFAAITGVQRGTPATFQTSGMTTRRTANAVPALPSYRSIGQQTFFSYLVNDEMPDSTVIASGRRTRFSPQGFFYVGPFGLLAEFIASAQRVQKGPSAATLTHRAWQVAGSYVFGGKALYEGVTVAEPFSVKKGTWGALELAARYNALDIDDDAFPLYADPTRSASHAASVGGLVTWHWSRLVKLSLSFERTDFEGGAANGDRKTENTLFQRVQVAF